MGEYKVLKCPSCGSSVVESDGNALIICTHCGSKMALTGNKYTELLSQNKQIRILLFAIIIIVTGFFIYTQVITRSTDVQDKEFATVPLVDKDKNVENKVPVAIKQNVKLQTPEKPTESINLKTQFPDVSIVHVVDGVTLNGGLYWIINIKNNNDFTVYRPGVVVSLYDNNDRLIDELRSWSKIKSLSSNETTEVFVFVSKPPTQEFRKEMSVIAKTEDRFNIDHEKLKIKDFLVRPKGEDNIRVEIVGEVYNPLDFQVKFVEIIAIAKDKSGNSVGYAKTFASTTNIPSKGTSGFKITAGTFVAENPHSWELMALGRK